MAVDRARRARREDTRQESHWQRIARDHRGHGLSPEESAILSSQEQEILRLFDTLRGLQRECLALFLVRRGIRQIAFGDCGEGLPWARGLIADCPYRMAHRYLTLQRPKMAIKSLKSHIGLRGLGADPFTRRPRSGKKSASCMRPSGPVQ